MNKLPDDSSSSNFETDVSELYQQRKQRHLSTSSMKRHTLRQADTKSNWMGLFSRFGQVAIAAGTILLISLIALQSYEYRQFSPVMEYTSVTIHSFEDSTVQDYSQIKLLYQQHTTDFLQQQRLLTSHHQQPAVLAQFEDGWELKTCDQALVKISKELVATLKSMDLINPDLRSGDTVQITYNIGGLIVGIQPATSLQQCT